jgi:hypothetical protein
MNKKKIDLKIPPDYVVVVTITTTQPHNQLIIKLLPNKSTTMANTSSSHKSDNAQHILSPAMFNPLTSTKYAKPKVNTSGGKSIGIMNAASGTVLQISSPMMLTWGVNSFTDEKTGKVTYDMALQFPNEEFYDENTRRFFDNLQRFESKVKDDAITNSKEWLGKPKMSMETIDALFTPMLRYPKDKNTLETDFSRAPTFKIKLPLWEGVWKNIDLYDMDRRLVFPDAQNTGLSPSDFILKGSQVAVGVQCGGIWFAGGKFGVTWNLVQAIIKPKMSFRGTCGIELPGDNAKRAAMPQPQTAPVQQDERESEEEDEEDEEEGECGLLERSMSSVPVSAPTPAAAATVAAAAAEEPITKKKIVRKLPAASH